MPGAEIPIVELGRLAVQILHSRTIPRVAEKMPTPVLMENTIFARPTLHSLLVKSSFIAQEIQKEAGMDQLNISGLTVDINHSVTEEDFGRKYDLTPLNTSAQRGSRRPSHTIDPWELSSVPGEVVASKRAPSRSSIPDTDSDSLQDPDSVSDEILFEEEDRQERSRGRNATFLAASDIHPNMEHKEDDIAQLRLLAGKLNADWRGQDFMAPALARRIRDFQFAQEKRRKKYGDERPWGILGLYDHLAAIRADVEWAEDAACRRANGDPYMSWADFDASKKQGVNRPFFIYFLLVTCTIFLIVSIILNGWQVEPLEVNVMIGPSAETLIRMGARDSSLIVNEGEVWRLLSATVLHAGLVHYVINMMALWFVGKAIETSHGMVAAAILFILPAIGGCILSAIFLPTFITVGASGGIFGLIGACLSDICMNWKLLFNDFVTENGKKHRHALVIVFLFVDIAINCLIGLTPYVDNFTHLGGMLFGLLCGLSTMETLPSDFFGMDESWWARAKQLCVRFLGLILSIIGIIIALVLLLEGDGTTTPCPNCQWLSCVPFPPWEDQGSKWWYCDDCGAVTAELVQEPSVHLQMDCPGGVSVAIGLENGEEDDRNRLEQTLPSYCRQFCPESDRRF